MFELNQIVPWGRSFDEYVTMFGLTADDLERRILSCADGPSGFNAGMTRRGHQAISCDPLYLLSAEQIRHQIGQSFDQVLAQTAANQQNFIWKNISSPDELGRVRMRAMTEFLEDLEAGKRDGRYLPERLPRLSFPDKCFDLVVCSHFLFLYSGYLTLDFHRQAIAEMCRLADEVRIFPLLDLDGKSSPYVEPLIAELRWAGHETRACEVRYEFQRGGNKMLRIKSPRPAR